MPRRSKPIVRPSDALRRLEELRDAAQAQVHQRFFRTGPGDYGEGDRFLGIRVPATRKLAREFRSLSLPAIEKLLASKWHEARLLALIVLTHQFERGDDAARGAIYRLYLRNTKRINNWDLVDVSAPRIVGPYLEKRDRSVLTRLARSKSLWERRIAILATQHFIRKGELEDTFRIAEILIDDEHDLIHKAAGWMLREAGKRDRKAEEAFLAKHYATMPRTMLRYAIELFPPALRRRFLTNA